MKLLLIHGRDQQGKDPDNLKAEWINSLKSGLSKSGLELPISDDDIIMPFYGDKMQELVNDADLPMEEIITRGETYGIEEARFFYDFLNEVAVNENISTEQIEAQSPEEIIERGPLNWPWVLAILRAIDKKGNWGELSIKRFTYDVFLYLTNQNVKRQINRIIIDKLPVDPCVVVGHSLGSVVGYNILRNHPNLNVEKYITVGSPLGVKAVKKYQDIPIQMPACVRNGWYNAYDKQDTVSLRPLDEDYFNISPPVINNGTVHNFTSNHHGIVGYLSDKDVAREIFDALSM